MSRRKRLVDTGGRPDLKVYAVEDGIRWSVYMHSVSGDLVCLARQLSTLAAAHLVETLNAEFGPSGSPRQEKAT